MPARFQRDTGAHALLGACLASPSPGTSVKPLSADRLLVRSRAGLPSWRKPGARLMCSVRAIQDGSIVHFRMKATTQLKKLMEAYCARQSLRMDQTRFLYHGIECQETHTPAELDIKEDDVIDSVVVHDPINVR